MGDTWTGTTSGDFEVAGNWLSGATPANNENLVITGTVSIDGDSTAVVNITGDLEITGYSGSIGSLGNPLTFDSDDGFTDNSVVYINSSGQVHVNFGDSVTGGVATAVAVTVDKTASVTSGYGAYLNATAMKSLTVNGGSVALGSLPDDSFSITNIYVNGGRVLIGSGVSATNIYVLGGEVEIDVAGTITSMDIMGGSVWKRDSQTITTLDMRAGSFRHDGGGIVTVNHHGGTIDTLNSDTTRTLGSTAYNHYGGTLLQRASGVTVSNYVVYSNMALRPSA